MKKVYENIKKIVLAAASLTMGLSILAIPASANTTNNKDVQLSSQKLVIDGNEVSIQAYNIGGYNYVKLRDMAILLNNTNSQFEVGYDEQTNNVTLTTGSNYTSVGGELESGVDKSSTCIVGTSNVTVDGIEMNSSVYNLDGNNFFKLRDLGNKLGFEVEYDSEKNMAVITTGSYGIKFDNTAWKYDAQNKVYWQIGVVYCKNPETIQYESMGIYVPEGYMNATDNGDGTYTCEINKDSKIGNYTADTAPVIIPVNTGGYSAQKAPTAFSGNFSQYSEEGFVYVFAGCRGKNLGFNADGSVAYNGGAPWGVTDLKAAVRYLRYNDAVIPGSAERIFTFGHSGGGAQSSLMGASGDSDLYYPYLESIGAAMSDDNGNKISDAIFGAQCWCPITSLDYADEAYEWNMGQYFNTNTRSETTWTKELSNDLANKFGEYINALNLKDENGNVLALEKSENGIYTKGSYYDYIVSVIEHSLNNFLSDTTFPYTPSNSFKKDGGFPGGNTPPQGSTGEMPMNFDNKTNMQAQIGDFGVMGSDVGNAQTAATTYETVDDYIATLNGDDAWITYDATTNTAKITSIEAFVKHCKNAQKNVGAFDDLNKGQAENYLFGNNVYDNLHFDKIMSLLLTENKDKYASYTDFNEAYVTEYSQDLTYVDVLGTTSEMRQNMYNPMYYLSDYYAGYKTSTPAKNWRIRTGITQGDTALTVEVNLALALEQYDEVDSVDFETVWAQGHTTAERIGDSTSNFIAWVNECCK
ncbi:MAG: carboxylesterase family protein [Clostridia bacterium]|nr:carboxylesterase family protein [Clostridia bacterium]